MQTLERGRHRLAASGVDKRAESQDLACHWTNGWFHIVTENRIEIRENRELWASWSCTGGLLLAAGKTGLLFIEVVAMYA